jgi:surface protein
VPLDLPGFIPHINVIRKSKQKGKQVLSCVPPAATHMPLHPMEISQGDESDFQYSYSHGDYYALASDTCSAADDSSNKVLLSARHDWTCWWYMRRGALCATAVAVVMGATRIITGNTTVDKFFFRKPTIELVTAQHPKDNTKSVVQPVVTLTNSNIRNAALDWIADPESAIETYGHIGAWDVSVVTDMSHVFENMPLFDNDISAWDVSSVTDMNHMFMFDWTTTTTLASPSFDLGLLKSAFNQDISAWDVSSVSSMSFMFHEASSFNQDISAWNVSSVIEMTGMFEGASSFNQDLSAWNVSSVTDMYGMFSSAKAFNQDISSWNVSSVAYMNYMFNKASAFNQDISVWDVSSVTDMFGMFDGASSFNQNLCAWGCKLPRMKYDSDVVDMFRSTSCPVALGTTATTVVLTSNPPGPFCYDCKSRCYS